MAEEIDFVYHDGVQTRMDLLLAMARNAGDYHIAEHYLNSLLFHAIFHHNEDIAKEVNKVREFYKILPYPNPKSSPASVNNMPDYSPHKTSPADQARLKYRKMTKEERVEVLMYALKILWMEKKVFFENKSCWIGIYLVVRDRLDSKIKQQDFYDYAILFTPEEWSHKLRIGKSTMSNMARYLSYEDRQEAYYDMTDNPWDDLCNEFWKILLNQILTKG